ncbi:MAG: hypothetical protein M3301_03405, partial [Chloroflexota bacterium]|nr:hypothetical protein [Chloroflexota bacterium]
MENERSPRPSPPREPTDHPQVALQPELALLPRALRPTAASLLAMPAAAGLLLAVALVLVIGLVDTLSGPELAFSIFYLLPITLATWRADDRWPMVVAT